MKSWIGWKEQVSCLRQISASGLCQQSVRKKSNQIRVFADFSTRLNQALKDHHCPFPSAEEIFDKLNGGKIFWKIDLSDAYLQIEVKENSSKLLCINTHRGFYKFNRLAFEVKVALAIFQQVMDAMLGNLDFATGLSWRHINHQQICDRASEAYYVRIQQTPRIRF